MRQMVARWCVEQMTTYPVKQSDHVYAWYADWEVCPKEREKRNMAAQNLQFKVIDGLEQGELARTVYANFFETSIPANHKNVTCRERNSVWRTQSSEDVTFVGRDE